MDPSPQLNSQVGPIVWLNRGYKAVYSARAMDKKSEVGIQRGGKPCSTLPRTPFVTVVHIGS